MFIPFADLGADRVWDCCIAGSGPAGMSLALALAERGQSVLLLEGGEDYYSDESQAVYQGKVVGDQYFDLDVARLRFLGGTSGHWNGWCRALDEVDFLPKAAFPDAHWPIRKADLDPYLDPAMALLQIREPIVDDEIPGSGLVRIRFGFSPPVRFGEDFYDTLETSDRIALCMNANLTGIATDGDQVTGFTVQDYEGNSVAVRAGRYVLACGGIENSRILLHAHAGSEGLLVKQDLTLGRYWMEHPHFTVGAAIFNQPATEGYFLSLTPETMERLGILSAGLRIIPTAYSGTRKIIADMACVVPALGEWAYRQLDRQLVCGSRIHAAWEQEPLFENRVALSATDTDRFGMPRVELHWRKSPRDLETIRKTVLHFGEYLARTDQGRLRVSPWVMGQGDYPVLDELAGYHHMGGTRMSDEPETGIVDHNCKVWGQRNLYVAGSSVFPSGGHANPTLSIVQLSLRLADHLAGPA